MSSNEDKTTKEEVNGPPVELEESKGEIDNVRVAIRCRPLTEEEIAAGFEICIQIDEVNGQVHILQKSAKFSSNPRLFSYDTVFGFDSKQMDIYNEAARPIINSVLEGYNGTIFAYGQTGTGKTFTMEGDRDIPEMKGIIPNSFAHIFGHIAKAEGEIQFLVRVSYMEIYNERVRDLLSQDKKRKLEVKERPDIGVYVKDLSSCVVKTADDMDRIMNAGNKNRVVAKTDMNLRYCI